MSRMTHGLAAALVACLMGCDAPPETTATTTTSAARTVATAAAAASATASAAAEEPEKKPSYPCPDGSEGVGTLKEPCKASGTARIMEVTWTGKIDDKGPKFKVVSKAKHEILYGNAFIYFYDKAGKQLDVEGKDGKTDKRIQCMGNIFAGPVKAGETIFVYFSCAKKKHVPEGTDAIEVEVRTAGFKAPDGKRSDTYWQNADLVPSERPKGGVK